MKPKVLNSSEIHGTFRGRELMMVLVSPQRATWLKRRWTRVIVDVANPEFVTLHLTRRDFLDNLLVSAGMTDLRVGHAEFDKRFMTRSNEPALITKMFQNLTLRDVLVESGVDSVDLVSSKLHVHYAREERDPRHAEQLFTAAAILADGIDSLKSDARPEIIHTR